VSRALRKSQQGAVLFIALIVLVAMSLAGIALMRSVDTGTIIAGNLAFRQNGMHVGDIGIEAARTWLRDAPKPQLYVDTPGITGGTAYYANWAENLDLLGNDPDVTKVDFNWSTALPVTTPAPPSGYSVSYVIHRLCKATGDPASVTCVKQNTGGSTSSGTKGAAAFGSYAIQVPTNALYRITVRVIGPRNNVSYVQAVVF
jgi:type IV pilus assembly protein PilX